MLTRLGRFQVPIKKVEENPEQVIRAMHGSQWREKLMKTLLALWFLVAMALPAVASAEISTATSLIADQTTTGGAVNTRGYRIVAIQTDSGINGTALTFSCSITSGGTFGLLKASPGGAALTYTVTTSSFYFTTPDNFAACVFIKPISGSTETGNTTVTFYLSKG